MFTVYVINDEKLNVVLNKKSYGNGGGGVLNIRCRDIFPPGICPNQALKVQKSQLKR